MRTAIEVLILIAEVLLGAYLSIVAWLLSGWMVDDAQAFTMEAFDWYSEAARRFLVALVVGAVYGGVLYVVNRRCLWSRFLGTFGRHLPLVLAVGIILAGAAGAIRFVVIRPFM